MNSSVPNYVVAHRTLLTEEQEQTLFKQWRSTGNPKLLEKIVRCYTPIVYKCAKRFSGYEVDFQDLVSEGGLALVESAHRFEIDKGFRFATFARTWVEGLMLAFITKNYFMVNVCSNQRMKKLFFNLRRMVNKETRHTSELHPLFFQKVAEQLSVSTEEVIIMYNLFKKPYESLSEPLGEEDSEEFTRESLLPSLDETPDVSAENRNITRFHQKIISEAVVKTLTEREKKIFEAQLLSEDDDTQTLQKLADQLGLSKERVRQIRDMAFRKVKHAIMTKTKAADKHALYQSIFEAS